MVPDLLKAKGVRAVLATHHKVIDVPHQVGFASQSRLDHSLKPQVEHVVQIHIAQQDADRSALRGSLFVRMYLSVFQNTCFQPAPDQADQARITDSMFDKPEQPLVAETPERRGDRLPITGIFPIR